MRKLLLLSTVLLIYGSLLLLLPDFAIAQPWEPSGTITVGKVTCISDAGCSIGYHCFNFQCFSCPGSPPVCQNWQSGGGCSFVNIGDGTPCDGAGFSCYGGSCLNCKPAKRPSLAFVFQTDCVCMLFCNINDSYLVCLLNTSLLYFVVFTGNLRIRLA